MTIYLYIKQCSHCQLKYFGTTIRKNPYSYKGSGKYWTNHLKKHGGIPDTLEIWSFEDQKEATIFALNFSEYNCIVESSLWANLIIEDGKKGGANKGMKMTYEQKEKISNTRKEKNLGKLAAKYLKPKYGDNNPMRNPEIAKKFSQQITGRKLAIGIDGKKHWVYPDCLDYKGQSGNPQIDLD